MIVYLNNKPRRQLNVLAIVHRMLEASHGDGTRSRKARLVSRDRKAAREMKHRYIPLCFVAAPAKFIDEWEEYKNKWNQ
jgi:hypothetical protein